MVKRTRTYNTGDTLTEQVERHAQKEPVAVFEYDGEIGKVMDFVFPEISKFASGPGVVAIATKEP